MNSNRLSIGFRLTVWYLAVFTAAQVMFGAGMWFVLRQSLQARTDGALQGQVEDLTRFLEAQKKNATVAKLQEEVAEAYVLEQSGDYLQIYDSNQNWIYRSPYFTRFALAPVDPKELQETTRQNIFLGDKPLRLLTQRVEVNGRVYAVQTALPTDQTIRILALFQRYLLLLALPVLLMAALGGYWLSRRALAPVDALTQTAERISGSNLNERLERLTTGDELQRLSDTLNKMLSRIETAFLRITRFTADASHELRTPISLIRTEAEIALRKSRTSAEYREALQYILWESEQTSSLIEQLLTLARADSGRETLRLSAVDLPAVVRAIGNEWKQLVESRGLEFALHIPDCSLTMQADRLALQRLFAILLDNAVKYTPAPGNIELGLQAGDGNAFVTVRDSGIGIPEEHQAKIFERFYRVDKARSREVGGAGIGLAIAQWIVHQHQGSITVESFSGSGSTFCVRLPLLSADTRKVQTEVATALRS